ncbi:unnamed protein product, partial [Porites evermanni]
LVNRAHVSTGSTPSKEKKRAKRSHSTAIRKTLFQRSESSNEPSPNRKTSLVNRAHVSTGSTPSKEKKRAKRSHSTAIRKTLFQRSESSNEPSPNRKVSKEISKPKCHVVSPLRKSPVKKHKWAFQEERALVEFVGLSKMDPKYNVTSTEWPGFRESHSFWSEAARHIQESTFANFLLSNNRVRGRVCTYLKGRFRSLEVAEETYNLTLSDALAEVTVDHPKQRRNNNTCSLLSIKLFQILQDLPCLDAVKLEKIVDASFLELALRAGINTNPGNFASLSAKAMKLLQSLGKTNLTMCSEFPSRFNRLFWGPMWSGLPKQQHGFPLAVSITTAILRPTSARPNVAAPRTRTLQKHTASSCDFTDKPELQILRFFTHRLTAAEQEYEKKFNAPTTSEELLKTLCWEHVEFNTLLQQAQSFIGGMSYCCRYETMISCLDPHAPRVEDVHTALCNIEKDSLTYLRNLFVKKRQPGATHVLLFLLSDERKNRKPYTMPIHYVPYKSIRDQFVRDLTVNIKTEMMRLGLKPVGTVTDGEFNSLRTQGSTRPLHLWQLIHDAKESVSYQREQVLKAMLVKIGASPPPPPPPPTRPSFIFHQCSYQKNPTKKKTTQHHRGVCLYHLILCCK